MRMLKVLFAPFFLLLVMPALALTEVVDGIEWTYTINNGVACVGSPSYPHSAINTSTSGAITIPSNLGGYSVTSIGGYAFCGCSGLTSVTIPDSVTSIGSCAFNGCSGLTNISVDSGNSLYKSDNGLLLSKDGTILIRGVNGNVIIPDSVTDIGDDAFVGSGLNNVVIPDSVTNLGVGSFMSCRSLTNVIIGAGVKKICGGDLTRGVFGDCSSLREVSIGSSVERIEYAAFWGCSSLHTVVLPSSVSTISLRAFSYCSSMTKIVFEGNAPSVEDDEYGFETLQDNCKGYIKRESTGWGVEMPGVWHGLPIDYEDANYKKITFNSNYGDFETMIRVVQADEEIGDLPIPIRYGYIYKGWGMESSGGAEVTSQTVVTNDIEVFAQWELGRYTATFSANGGYGGGHVTDYYGETLEALEVSRLGYTFKGWFPSVPEIMPGEDTKYLAQWNINQYNVTFDANGGDGGTIVKQDYNTTIVPPLVIRIGYTFVDWSPEVPVTVPANDVTYIAQWNINQYNVTFDANGGDGSVSEVMDYGTEITPPTVTRIGYTFAGWSPNVDETVPARDVTYVAQWTPNKYRVTFDANGGVGGWIEDLDCDSEMLAPTVTREGYTFIGWDKGVVTTVPAEDVTYTAQWEINQYTITFDANGGEGSTSEVMDYGTEITPPTVTRSGYTFAGWYPKVNETVPARDVTYIAQWTPNKYRVTFDANGGEGGVEELLDYDSEIVLPHVTREGHRFLGWFTEADGGVQIASNTTVSGNTTFYAHWQKTWTIVFNTEGGTVVEVSRIVDDGACIGELPVSAKASATFLGWFVEGDVQVTPDTIIENDTILYATWLDGDWEWTVTDDSTTITKVSDASGDIIIPEQINGRPVVAIGASAFEGCQNVVSVMLPASIKSIGQRAFYGCSALTNVDMRIGLETIGNHAFAYCKKLVKADIPDGVRSIGKYAFAYCNSLKSARVPDSVTNMGIAVFRQCYALTDVEMPKGLNRISQWCYSDCTGLTNVVIHSDVTLIEQEAFAGCTKLLNVAIPDSVETIRTNAFANCNSLRSVTLGTGLKRVEQGAFEYCPQLREIHIADLAAWCDLTIETYTSTPFGSGYSLYLGDELLTDLTIPEGTVDIHYKVFDSCVSLAYVTMPMSVTNVGWSAFRNCTNLVDVVIGRGVKSIQKCAFEGCRRLEAVMIPRSVEMIGIYAFYGTKDLTFAFFPSEWQGRIDDSMFQAGAANLEIRYYYDDGPDVFKVCMIAFDGNGIQLETSDRRIVGGYSVGMLPDVTRWGYAFMGWWTAEEGGDEVSAETIVADSMTLYARWTRYEVDAPIISPADGAVFYDDLCEVSITCGFEGATIYYSDEGSTPKLNEDYLYNGAFTVTDTTTIKAVAVFEDVKSAYTTVTITKKVLTFEEALGSCSKVEFSSNGTLPWLPVFDAEAKAGGQCARSGAIGDSNSSWLTAQVAGAGTLSFWCKTSCEHDEDDTFTWDRLMIYTNDVEVVSWRMDGESGWTHREVTFDEGINTVKWRYYKDKGSSAGEDCVWLDEVLWTPKKLVPTIEDDLNAVVTGDAEKGYTIKPSEGKTDIVVTIPDGVAAEKVTVEVSPTAKVKPNGAKVKVMKSVGVNSYNIAEHLDLESVTDSNGVIDLANAKVKQEIADKVFEGEEAKIDFSAPAQPLKTAPTKHGLVYKLMQGSDLNSMLLQDTKVGDGNPWQPTITPPFGNKAFYYITIEK